MTQQQNQQQGEPLENLLKSLKKNKDAVIILGDKCAPNLLKITEDTKDIYNRKTMVKQPKEFWTYYRDKIYNQDFNHTAISNAINNLIYTGLVKTVINLNYDDNINKVLSKDKNVDIRIKRQLSYC